MYETPTQEVFEDFKQAATKVWSKYDDKSLVIEVKK